MANKKADKLAERIRRLFGKETPKTQDELDMQQVKILKNNLYAQTAYTPEARRVIDGMKFELTKEPGLYGQYNSRTNTIFINPETLRNPKFALENIRHEINHALDDNVRNANMITNTDSAGFYPEYQETGTPKQKKDLQKFYNREFDSYGKEKKSVPQRLADIEGFAQTGAPKGQNVLVDAPKGVQPMYEGVYQPFSPAPNYSPVYNAQSTVSPIKRKYTQKYLLPDEAPQGQPAQQKPQQPMTGNQPSTSFQNVVGGADAPSGNPNWDAFVSAAKKVAVENNFPLAVILGQAALETGRRSSPGNNFFGIKGAGTAGSNNLATKEATPEGQFYDTTSSFAAYKSMEDSIKAYIDLIKKRFPKAYEKRNDPNAMIQAIKEGGYATDPNYVAKVRSTPEFQKYANYRPAAPVRPQASLPVMIGAPVPQRQAMPSATPTYRPPAQVAQVVPAVKPAPAPLRSISQSGSQTQKPSILNPKTRSGLRLTI